MLLKNIFYNELSRRIRSHGTGQGRTGTTVLSSHSHDSPMVM